MSKTKTFRRLIERSVELYAQRDAYRIRTKEGYRSVTFTQMYDDVCNLAATLESKGFSGKNIALLGENSYEWVISYLAVVVNGSTIVPIDKELSLPEIATIVEQSESCAMFCSADYSEDVADELKKEIDIEYFTINTSRYNGYTTLSQLIDAGSKLRIADPQYGQREVDEQHTASIVFTSGTTGFSKGVMLSRHNLLTNVEASDDLIQLGDCTLSVLPMHHTYEFTLDVLFSIYQGRALAINNSIKYFAQNMKIFAPSDILIVPLVAENLLINIWQNVRSQNKEKRLRSALKVSNFLLRLGIDLRRRLFKDIHEAMGGRLRQFFIGGAPLDIEVAHGLHELGFTVCIGYGITECSPLVTGNITNRPSTFGSCGTPIPGVEIRLVNKDENGDGEIQVRAESVMKGYYKNDQATMAVFDQEWFRTGDIGRLDRNGMLYITGRVKNLIVLKNGKNVYPEEMEGLIGKVREVKEVVVSASESSTGGEVAIVAEIFPDLELYPNPEPEIRKAVAEINETLPYYKRIVEIVFRTKEFPKTTTKKIKRY